MHYTWYPKGDELKLLCQTYGVKRRWFGLESDGSVRARLLKVLEGMFG